MTCIYWFVGIMPAIGKLARVAFKKDAGQYEKLILTKGIARNREKFVQQARHFYNQILGLADIQTVLEPYGLSTEVVEGVWRM